MGSKRDLYAELGVGEYWRYDETGGDFYGEPLVGERLVDGEYRRLELHRESDGGVWCHSEVLNLDLWWDDGDLRFWDPVAGNWLLSHEEERTGRLDAEARVAELEAKLRRLRGSRSSLERSPQLSIIDSLLPGRARLWPRRGS